MSDNPKAPVTEIDLAEYDDEYVQHEVNENQFEAIPDGRYQCRVEGVELTRSLRGDPMLKWTLMITGPTHAGRKLWRNNGMATSENRGWLKRDLFSCGLRLERLSELPANLDRLLDITLDVTVKNRTGDDGKTYSSVYINKKIAVAGEPAGGSNRTNEALSRF